MADWPSIFYTLIISVRRGRVMTGSVSGSNFLIISMRKIIYSVSVLAGEANLMNSDLQW